MVNPDYGDRRSPPKKVTGDRTSFIQLYQDLRKFPFLNLDLA
ncbi:MAG: hypothetical protein ACFE0I_13780 [Elainellaceae cyanobacterium]